MLPNPLCHKVEPSFRNMRQMQVFIRDRGGMFDVSSKTICTRSILRHSQNGVSQAPSHNHSVLNNVKLKNRFLGAHLKSALGQNALEPLP